MTQVTDKIDLKSLYEIDDHLWLEKTVDLLKEKRFNDLDLENLIEELESLSKRDKARVASLLEQIIRHLLMLQYWSKEYDRNSNHWKVEIISFRNQLDNNLTNNLIIYLEKELDKIYSKVLRYVKQKTENIVDFPDTCPYSLEQILDDDYF
ncbi:DUF29 domain-containing protein [Geminocystis sp. NIES-3709]|uniref:DUF29 domain-containing protein n=1 Tax=Geminocystis sp. NIES-3709 TaxID=1617448 RepID=UPI0005FC66D5|nr:DUF29 domain-containing protein [Geminocystis sp. NIES-3709]BAQ63619.1 hypothetical protein GM3709_384 [Geminocystis sp. NIES-3709]